ncbi:ribokinase [Apostasia shenzhenica]|uniref:Ribokinase n=1 Tax=Apostasia shenzhenica TaxID=1088818 RepID=A0A2I0AWJ2_9ASPA|nr:ribokinase [Apostasia shenzhenica]
MESARRRLKSVADHLLHRRIFSDLRIDSLLLGSMEQLSESSPSPVVIGGMVLDVLAKPDASLNPGSTSPGTVQYVSGGVARNVAECMTKLGSKPFMISIVGFDMAGDLLLKFWESTGLSTEGILKLKDFSTPIVSSIFDYNGDLVAGVASVHAVEKFLSPNWIIKFKHRISSAPLLMVDANLSPQSLEAACLLAAESGTLVWFEPVSVTKSEKIASVIDYVTCASPNEKELISMANVLSPGRKFYLNQHNASTSQQPQKIQLLFHSLNTAIQVLLMKGIRLLVVTLGADGVFLCFSESVTDFLRSRMKRREPNDENSYAFHLPALTASVVSVTGAGDCLVAGILASLCAGLDIMQSTAAGIAVAKAAVEIDSNVPIAFSFEKIASEVEQVLAAAKQFFFY